MIWLLNLYVPIGKKGSAGKKNPHQNPENEIRIYVGADFVFWILVQIHFSCGFFFPTDQCKIVWIYF